MNFAAFAIFAALLTTEIMGSVLLLLFWDVAKSKVLAYVVPIWEVTGTFGAFWVVTGDFAFPALLVPVAAIFGALLTIFLILVVARNASIVFAEFITKRKWLDEKKLYQLYSLSTLLLGVVVLVLMSALVSGEGVDLKAGTFSLADWIYSPGSLPFVIGALLIGVGLAPVFYSLSPFRKFVLPMAAVGILVSILSLYLYSPSLISSWVVVPILLTLAAAFLYLTHKTDKIVSNKGIFISLLSIIIFSLQFLIYPSVLGRAVQFDSVTTTGPMASAYLTITLIGTPLLVVMIAFYMTIAGRGKERVARMKA